MLGKLIKYDIRSTWRDFAGVYLSIFLGVIIVPQLFNHFTNDVVNMLGGFMGTAIVISTIVIMIIMLFRIFNTNVFSKEGYLTMTLPVTSTQIVVSKLLVSTMWIVLTGIVSAIGLIIFILNLNATPPRVLLEAVGDFLNLIQGNHVQMIILFLLMLVFSAVKEIAKLFLACSVAHLKQLGRLRVFLGILTYFILSWIETLIVQIMSFIARLLPNFPELEHQLMLLDDLTDINQFPGVFNVVIIISILYAAVLTVLYSAGVIGILNRKLDLD